VVNLLSMDNLLITEMFLIIFISMADQVNSWIFDTSEL
jgi:hypothetical protein